MNKLFDQLQLYIDKKIEDSTTALEQLFEDNNMELIGTYMDELLTVADNMESVVGVYNSMPSVIKCSRNMAAIKNAPQAAKDAELSRKYAEIFAIQAREDMLDAHSWAQEEEDTPVQDGEHPTGFSSYHWATKASESNPELFLHIDGSKPMTGNLHIATTSAQRVIFENSSGITGGMYHSDETGQVVVSRYQADGLTTASLLILGSDGVSISGPNGGPPVIESPQDLVTMKYVDDADVLKYDKTDFITESAGVADAGKPIVLDGTGYLHPTISGTGLYPVGMFTPATGAEYPDTTNYTRGAYWGMAELPPEGWTFTEGDLTGVVLYNGDSLIHGETEWGYIHLNIDPTSYYFLDGTKPIIGAFAGGGQQFKNAADGTEAQDLVTVNQISSFSTDFVLRDGTLAMTGNLQLGTKKITGMGVGTVTGDAVEYQQHIDASNSKVNKSGDTMTGNLPIKVPADCWTSNYQEFCAGGYLYSNGGYDVVIGNNMYRNRDGTMSSLGNNSVTDTGAHINLNIDGSIIFYGGTYVSGTKLPLMCRIGTDGNISVDGAAPTGDNHLTRKDYVDTFLSKSGGTMTDDLRLTNGAWLWFISDVAEEPEFRINHNHDKLDFYNHTDSTYADVHLGNLEATSLHTGQATMTSDLTLDQNDNTHIWFSDGAVNRGILFRDHDNNSMTLRNYDVAEVTVGEIILKSDGFLEVKYGGVLVDEVPSSGNHLTNKDYVDAGLAKLLTKITALEKEVQILKGK